MRRAVVRNFGGGLGIEETEPPVAADDETLVTPLAVEVQPLDRQVAAGAHPSAVLPLQPGMSGVVADADGRTHVALGGAAGLGLTRPGLLADQVVVPTSHLVALPGEMDPVRVAAAVSSIATARYVLDRLAELQSGETVLVLGATGAVGSAATVLAARAGATVLAAARRPDAVDAGDAVHALHLDDLTERVPELTSGRGVDVIIDNLGGAPSAAAIGVGAIGCRHVLVGYVVSTQVDLRVTALMARQHRLIGANLHQLPLAELRRTVERSLADLQAGDISTDVALTVPLASAQRAFDHTAPGRAVVEVATPAHR